VLVAAHRLPGQPIEVAEPIDPTASQHLVHGQGGESDPLSDGYWPEALFPAQAHDLAHDRR
jgi:hypothetical protein